MAGIEIFKLTVKEVKLLQKMTGRRYGQIMQNELAKQELEDDTMDALALIYLRRTEPDATVEDAQDVGFMEMMIGDPEQFMPQQSDEDEDPPDPS